MPSWRPRIEGSRRAVTHPEGQIVTQKRARDCKGRAVAARPGASRGARSGDQAGTPKSRFCDASVREFCSYILILIAARDGCAQQHSTVAISILTQCNLTFSNVSVHVSLCCWFAISFKIHNCILNLYICILTGLWCTSSVPGLNSRAHLKSTNDYAAGQNFHVSFL